MRTQLYIFLVLALSLTACSRFVIHREDDVVAEVGTHKQHKSDLEAVTANAADSTEAAEWAEAYIKQWATDILFYEKARAGGDPAIEELVENYRRSLYLHRYEQELVDRKMPKQVPADSIKACYEANKSLFVLHEDLLKGILMIVPQSAPCPEKVKKWLLQPEHDLEQLEKYAYQYATGYQLFTDEWTSGNRIIMRMPFEQTSFSKQIRSNDYIELQDSAAIYMLLITDKRFVGDPMPLEYAEPQIKATILQRRQTYFLQRQREAIYEDALGGKLKIYL